MIYAREEFSPPFRAGIANRQKSNNKGEVTNPAQNRHGFTVIKICSCCCAKLSFLFFAGFFDCQCNIDRTLTQHESKHSSAVINILKNQML